VLPISVLYEKSAYVYIAQAILLAIPIIYARVTRKDLRDYGLRVTRRLMLQGIGLSIIIGIGLSFISSPVTLSVGLVLLVCILAPVCEEFFFRGFLQTLLMENVKGGKRLLRLNFSYGLMLSALIFGVLHLLYISIPGTSLAGVVINAILAVVFGLLMGYIYQETRSILTPVLMHSLLNGLSLLPL
jgi:membrane protease YdiL (CAAX protease family)